MKKSKKTEANIILSDNVVDEVVAMGQRGRDIIGLCKTVIEISINSPIVFPQLLEIPFGRAKSVVNIYEEAIFTALTKINPECANVLISKLDTPSCFKSELFEAVKKKNKTKFVELVLNEKLDLSIIEPPCNVIFHTTDFLEYIHGLRVDDEGFDESCLDDILDHARYKVIAITNHSRGSIVGSAKLSDSLRTVIKSDVSECERFVKSIRMVTDNMSPIFKEYTPYIFALIKPFLTYSEQDKIKKGIDKLYPQINLEGEYDREFAFEKIQEGSEKLQQIYNSESCRHSIIGEVMALLPEPDYEELTIEETGEESPVVDEGEAMTATNEGEEVAATNDSPVTSIRKTNKKGSWLKAPKESDYEKMLGWRISKEIWPDLQKAVGVMEFEELKGTNKDTQIKYLCAIFVHQTALTLNYANPLEDKSKSSFERVMKFAKITRQTLGKFDEMMEAYYIEMENKNNEYCIDHEGAYYDGDSETMIEHENNQKSIDDFRARNPLLYRFLAKNFDDITQVLEDLTPRLENLLSEFAE